MQLTVPVDDGDPILFECEEALASAWVCRRILDGSTYPIVGFVDGVRTILDVGANCGATSVHLARHYPGATVHAFEPAPLPRTYLERNAAPHPQIIVHPFGLHRTDQVVPLYRGDGSSITASVEKRDVNLDESDEVELRAAGPWAAQQGIQEIDVLKVDVEGAEVEVLESLGALLATVKVLYVEYDSRAGRRRIDDLLRDTHELYFAMLMALDQGECLYLRKDLADAPQANEQLLDFLRQGVEGEA